MKRNFNKYDILYISDSEDDIDQLITKIKQVKIKDKYTIQNIYQDENKNECPIKKYIQEKNNKK